MRTYLLGRRGDLHSFRPLAVMSLNYVGSGFFFVTESEPARKGFYRTDGTRILGFLDHVERFDEIDILSEEQPPKELLRKQAQLQRPLVQEWFDNQIAAGLLS